MIIYSVSHKIEISERFKSHKLEFKGQASSLKFVEKIDEWKLNGENADIQMSRLMLNCTFLAFFERSLISSLWDRLYEQQHNYYAISGLFLGYGSVLIGFALSSYLHMANLVGKLTQTLCVRQFVWRWTETCSIDCSAKRYEHVFVVSKWRGRTRTVPIFNKCCYVFASCTRPNFRSVW